MTSSRFSSRFSISFDSQRRLQILSACSQLPTVRQVTGAKRRCNTFVFFHGAVATTSILEGGKPDFNPRHGLRLVACGWTMEQFFERKLPDYNMPTNPKAVKPLLRALGYTCYAQNRANIARVAETADDLSLLSSLNSELFAFEDLYRIQLECGWVNREFLYYALGQTARYVNTQEAAYMRDEIDLRELQRRLLCPVTHKSIAAKQAEIHWPQALKAMELEDLMPVTLEDKVLRLAIDYTAKCGSFEAAERKLGLADRALRYAVIYAGVTPNQLMRHAGVRVRSGLDEWHANTLRKKYLKDKTSYLHMLETEAASTRARRNYERKVDYAGALREKEPAGKRVGKQAVQAGQEG